ncbi:hypothetical protein SAMN05216388_101599 [Halorientalis persicus]|uniref:Uncharacterized protein n=1 Tax=Halorientalis persicus TaxID=1367881 RepID=A0A1H8R6V3_9EURY|nr:hypothetical protein [Halorientalis persicus]SEO62100.1 hypothetical protein SAMN05216388_101599 [Halorientalis persicus]
MSGGKGEKFVDRRTALLTIGSVGGLAATGGSGVAKAIGGHRVSSQERTATPPFPSTTRLAPDLIISQDPTDFEELSRDGRGKRTVFDRRKGKWTTIDAYLFTARYEDSDDVIPTGFTNRIEFQANPEFGYRGSWQEAFNYAREIGRLPRALQTGLDTVVLHRGDKSFGGKDGNILIHTDKAEKLDESGYLQETLLHEGTHASLDGEHTTSSGWKSAQKSDPTFITSYAERNPAREDLAASFVAWIAVRHLDGRVPREDIETIKETIPNRLRYLDRQNFSMAPLVRRISDPITEPPFTLVYRISQDAITAEDSTIKQWSFSGRSRRNVYDAREGQYTSIKPYLFEAQYPSGRRIEFQVNPEYEFERAKRAVEKYADAIGSLPWILIGEIDDVAIHLGKKAPRFRDGSLIVHANRAFALLKNDVLEEIFVRLATKPLHERYAQSPEWTSAKDRDGAFVSDFATRSHETDFGESFLAWMLARYLPDRIRGSRKSTVTDTIPNRIRFFDDQDFGMWPYNEFTN